MYILYKYNTSIIHTYIIIQIVQLILSYILYTINTNINFKSYKYI